MTVISRGSDAPILMSAPMVRSAWTGNKTDTRRFAWEDAGFGLQDYASEQLEDMELRGWLAEPEGAKFRVYKPTRWQKVKPGDLLWVRETWRAEARNDALKPNLITPGSVVSYDADYDREPNDGCRGKTRVSIHMPRWASRLTLEVTAVRVERLQDISEEDAKAEGVDAISLADVPRPAAWSRRQDFSRLWTSINGPGSWEANPWIVAVSFKAHRQNIDQIKAAQSAPLNMKGDEG